LDDCKDCECGYYCDGQPDETRTDLKEALEYLKSELPSYEFSGPCDPGYWCETGQSHPRQHIADPGYYTTPEITGTDINGDTYTVKGACG